MEAVRTKDEIILEIGRLAEELLKADLEEDLEDSRTAAVLSWVLVLEGQSMEQAQDDSYTVISFRPEGQRWTSTIGLLQSKLHDLLNSSD